MGLSLIQVKNNIIGPVDKLLPARVKPCVPLALGTMMVESQGSYLRQIGGGPASSFWQMEEATHDDCYNNFLRYNSDLMSVAKLLQGQAPFNMFAAMAGNMWYAYFMMRIKYFRAIASLPSLTDALALANYHKDIYNTAGGATDVSKSTALFAKAIAAIETNDETILA